MIVYENNHTDPYFNLACEQYLLDKAGDEEIFMLWQNEPSVIIGKNQNAYAELNMEFINENKIKVVRRLTGGGAVFHDLGNVNFTFIVPKRSETTLNFELFTRPVIKALRALGADAELSGRNDIVVDGYKISGNAQCGYNGKIMHHGTLLYNADISKLAGSLNVNEAKIKSKGVRSVRNRVANIADFIDSDLETVEFKKYIESCVEADKRLFSEDEETEIQKSADEKYSTWEWNFGKSKEYRITNTKYFPFGLIELNVDTDAGVIRDIKFNGDYFGLRDIFEFERRFIGLRYDYEAIAEELYGVGEYIMGACEKDILDMII